MDSKDRDKSKIRQREETLARRVGKALDQMNLHGAGDCPDAEVIAAYAEQALGSAESAHWEGHFAACATCRKVLRVLSALADTALTGKEVAQLGELVTAVRAPVEISGRAPVRGRPRFADWRMRWLAPAFGVAAVLAVWFAMRPPWRATRPGASETLVAQAPKEEVPLSSAPPELDRASRIAPTQDQETQAAPSPNRSTANTRTLNSPMDGLEKRRAEASKPPDRISPNTEEATSSLQQQKKLTAQLGAREIQPPAVPHPPPPPQGQAVTGSSATPPAEAKAELGTPAAAPLPQVRAQANEAIPATPEAPRSARQSVTVTESAPQAGTTTGTLGRTLQQGPSADLPSNERNYKALAAIRPATEYTALLKSPSGSIWRAGKGGTVERSNDAGKTWAPQESPSQEDWLAGAAVSDTVCWLVGRNGAIARTVDGMRWERVAPPAQAAGTDAKLPDWTGITARDAMAATISASDGRKFATADGGKTWLQQ